MELSYDIFEVFEDGALIWRGSVTGRDAAMLKLRELANSSPHEFRLMHIPTNAVIATTKSPEGQR